VFSPEYPNGTGPEATACRRKRRALRQSALSSMATISDFEGKQRSRCGSEGEQGREVEGAVIASSPVGT